MAGSVRGSLFDRAISRAVPLVPRPIVRSFAAPYIAGDTLQEGIAKVRDLNRVGLHATVDILGESVEDGSRNDAVVSNYKALLDAISTNGLDANISLKPGAFGSSTDWGGCEKAITAILEHAATLDTFVRIDMEDSPTTDDTLAMYRDLRAAGFSRTGVVLQARLWRTLRDIDALADLVPNVRLCKGIYLEPPAIGMQDYDAIRGSFSAILRRLLENGSYVGIATHDEFLIVEALRIIRELDLSPDAYEFQMLLGIRADLARMLAREHKMRLYVPYGSEASAYSQRRMAANPAMAGLVTRAVLHNLMPKGKTRTQ